MVRLDDKYEAGGVEASLARGSSVDAREPPRLAFTVPPAGFFLKVMPWPKQKSQQRAAAHWDAPFVQCRSDLIQREVGMRADRAQIAPNPLQRRSAPSTRHWSASPILAKALHPADCRTGADLKLFGRFTSRSSCLHEVNYANPNSPDTVPALASPLANQCFELAQSALLGKCQFTQVGTRCSAESVAFPPPPQVRDDLWYGSAICGSRRGNCVSARRGVMFRARNGATLSDLPSLAYVNDHDIATIKCIPFACRGGET